MRWALPNAHFYGLTGTPISGIDRNTFKLFGAEEDPGRYMSRYSYKQSIRDGATNPVKFEPRLAELRVDRDAINEEFEQLVNENNLDEEESSIVQTCRQVGYHAEIPRRMAAVSNDIVEHFTSHVMPKKMKGMVVVYDREACVQMYYLLGEKLGFDAVEVVMNVDRLRLKLKRVVKDKLNKDWLKWHDELELPVKQADFERWQHIDAEEQVQKDQLNVLKILSIHYSLSSLPPSCLRALMHQFATACISISLYAIILFFRPCAEPTGCMKPMMYARTWD